MAKKDLFDAFDGFSQNLMVTLAKIEAIKKQVQDLVEENTRKFALWKIISYMSV